jgi:enoyl-CoA hydratase/carnithine racemase
MSVSQDATVRLTQSEDGRIAWVTLNRPEKRNAMDEASQQLLRDALHSSVSARVLVLTGAGNESFCAGVDKRELVRAQHDHPVTPVDDSWLQVCNELRNHPAVVIAAVNGYALGGGLTLVNAADLAVAGRRATFGMPEITFATFPRLSGTSSVRRCLPKHVSWLALTGERINATTALQWGLVNEVVDDEQLTERSNELARHIAGFDAVALAWTKRGLHEVELAEWERALGFGSYVRTMVLQGRVAP